MTKLWKAGFKHRNPNNKLKLCKCGDKFNSNVYDECRNCRNGIVKDLNYDLYLKIISFNPKIDIILPQSILNNIKGLKNFGYSYNNIFEFIRLSRTLEYNWRYYKLRPNYKWLVELGVNNKRVRSSLEYIHTYLNHVQISQLLSINQATITRIFKTLNIKSRSRRSSKIHLSMKPLIESILNNKTITEYPLINYFIDEFDPVRNLCIEIDGGWCHNEEHDSVRDDKLNKAGFTVVRIPSYSNYDEIKKFLSPYVL